MAKNVSYTGGFIGGLASLVARAIPHAARVIPAVMSGQLVYFLLVLTNRLVAVMLQETVSICTNMINATEYRNANAMVSIWLHIHVLLKVMDCS